MSVRNHTRVRLDEEDYYWRVEVEGAPGLDVELPAHERMKLELTGDEIHDLLAHFRGSRRRARARG